ELRPDLPRAHPRGLRAAAARRHPRPADSVHAPRRAGGRLDLDRPDPQRLGCLFRRPAGLFRRQLGPVRRRGADRARRPHLARGRPLSPAPRTFANKQELADALSQLVASSLDSAVAQRGQASLAVSGGSTPALFFRTLSTRDDLPWDKVAITLVDE